ncbi:MAG: serine/threonine-protein kinase [Polyangiaceae bacterium]
MTVDRGDEARASYLAHLDTLAIDPGAFELESDGTILAPQRRLAEAVPLPSLRLSGAGEGVPELRLEEQVARGGMGAVHLATQLPLGRRVAVKRPLHDDPRMHATLLAEARVTGALQHPNIVPVHTLGLGPDGEPMLVMRFIEGTRWSERITPLYPEPLTGDDDPVDEHLRILVQVCHAVELAHAMRVLHLDLKPDNVMLGQFGEVYVLDWGLAVAMDPTAVAPLPLASDIRHVAGTPAYMAPEMAAADGEAIGEATDVYLLGAILYELLTGAPPHLADRPIDALASAFSSEPPPLGDEVPRELAELCRRALRFDPLERFSQVRKLREAILAFLRHRASARAASRALERVDELAATLGRGAPDADEVAALVGEARFGLQEATRQWPGNREAVTGLRRLVALHVDHHLARGDVAGAAAALRDLSTPDAALKAKVDEALAAESAATEARERELRELREAARQSKLGGGPDLRRRVAISAIGIVLPLAALFVRRVVYGQPSSYPEALAVTGVFLLVTLGNQRSIKREVTEMTRKVGRAMLLATAMVGATFAFGWAAGVPFTTSMAMVMLPTTAMLLTGSVLVHRALAVAAIPLVAATVLILVLPALRGLWIAVALGATILLGGRVWDRIRSADAER